MKCINPNCNYFKTYVLNSRVIYEGKMQLRRLYCPKCKIRYTTYETILYDNLPLHWFTSSNQDMT
jgi:transcriptional regulator NrdR family protein